MFRKLFLSLALLLFTLTACEFQEPVESSPVPAAAVPVRCPPEYRSVDLQFAPHEPNGYDVTLQTGTFYVDHCMCRMVSYQLYVTRLSAEQWGLTVLPGYSASFATGVNATGTEDILIIDDLEPIFHYIGYAGNGKLLAKAAASPVLNPTLYRAGGLCVIENYDGSGPGGTVAASPPVGSTATGPIIQMRAGPLPDSYYVVVYIPVGITAPI